MNPKAMAAYKYLIAQREAILMDFVTSGAMVRDLSTEVGPMEWIEVAPFQFVVQQEFRVV